MKSIKRAFLYAATDDQRLSTATVVAEVASKEIADVIVQILAHEYSESGLKFYSQAAEVLNISELIALREVITELSVYDDPDAGVYEPRPPKEFLDRAQIAIRCKSLEEFVKDELSRPADTLQSKVGIILLLRLAQLYYNLLQHVLTTASWGVYLDMNLNDAYFWTIKNITNLLKNDPHLKEFPIPFQPLLPDLYPSTVQNLEWEDMHGEADAFLSAVQRFRIDSEVLEPAKDTNDWALLEVFSASINDALEVGKRYERTVRAGIKKILDIADAERFKHTAPSVASQSSNQSENLQGEQHNFLCDVFISYAHKDKPFLTQLDEHLKPVKRRYSIQSWSDQEIAPGARWFSEIQQAVQHCKVGLVLVSPSLLASDFVHEHELGPLLKRAQSNGVTLLWALVKDCNWKMTEIANLQSAYPVSRSLANMRTERNRAYVGICEALVNTLIK